MTARIEGSAPGAKGISVFFVPALRENGVLNYNIRRLKDKMGTIAVPTGEIEFHNSEAYPLGSREYGIYIAMEILTISRIDDAIAAVGIARKALWEACLYSHKRKAFGEVIADHELMVKDLVEMESDLEAAVVLSLLSAKKFEAASGATPPYNGEYDLARMLGSMAKNVAAETSAHITRYSMEIMGGNGFMEEFPIAKFHRDSIVTSIWEGTSNIQALEFLEVIIKKKGDKLLRSDLESRIKELSDRQTAESLSKDIESVFEKLRNALESGEGEFHSKDLLTELGNLTASVYMFIVGQQQAPDSSITATAARVFYQRHFHPEQAGREFILGSVAITEWMLEKNKK